ncbi:MAG: hypothetical protein GY703_21135 [Gammaproteobacteria bacterium]|nr:hypothetical protein [Gammaproteobacteria bacterium]
MNSFGRFAGVLIGSLITGLMVRTSQGTIAQTPLFLVNTVKPNIMFTLDDSSSMALEVMPDDGWTTVVFPLAAAVYAPDQAANIRLPDTIVTGTDDAGNEIKTNAYSRRARSNSVNRIYYNPALEYVPWSNPDSTLMDPANINCALHNPVVPAAGCLPLTEEYAVPIALWQSYDGDGTAGYPPVYPNGISVGSRTYWPAVYFQSNGVESSWNPADYTKVEIRSGATYTGSENRRDCTNVPICTYEEEIQNYANWYTYYRSRILLARAGIGSAFSGIAKDSQNINNNFRIGFAAINSPGKTVDGVASAGTIVKGVRPFVDYVDEAGLPVNNRTEFFENLYQHPLKGDTPLRQALDDVGQYFQREDNKGPWGEYPGTEDTTPQWSCRQSYNILMTDGNWNGAPSRETSVDGALSPVNGDDTAGPMYSYGEQQYQYTPELPFSDSQSETLADVAMFYWKRDLHTTLDNNVPVDPIDDTGVSVGELGVGGEDFWRSTENPAFWQHLVNHMIVLGRSGTLDPESDLPALTDGTRSWPAIVPDGPTTIDDVWHAAVNSRGEFHSTSNARELVDSIKASLDRIVKGPVSSVIGVTDSTSSLNTDRTRLYRAGFDSTRWMGELAAFEVDELGVPAPGPFWWAGRLLDQRNPDSRAVFTHDAADSDGDGHPGVEFLWNEQLPGSVKEQLDHHPGCGLGPEPCLGEQRLAYLRGDRGFEQANGGLFRNRSSALGDIINSYPRVQGHKDFGYGVLPGEEGTRYTGFRNSTVYNNRPEVVFIGTNEGKLHAFHATTGEELFAYIPESIFPELWQLTDPGYTHRYFVDGNPVIGDAFVDGTWKSILVGTLGAGGRGVFALDVTDPVNFDKSDVMWEFGGAENQAVSVSTHDGDLGYNIRQASIVRLANGRWAAVFGNGYESENHRAVLYIVDLGDGSLIRRIDTLAGDPGQPNGLSAPVAVDLDGDRIIDRFYAGDLLGKLWVFDVSGFSPGDWGVYHTHGGFPMPLFETRSTDGLIQPITVMPQVQPHSQDGVLIYFGTGRYYADGDHGLVAGNPGFKNTFYGLWDDFNTDVSASDIGRHRLLEQRVTHESRTISQHGNFHRVILDGDGNATDNPFPVDLRVSSNNEIDWSTHKGWYMDLESPVLEWEGERVVHDAQLIQNRVVFHSVIHSSDLCNGGYGGWMMQVDAMDGSRLNRTPFDLNEDGTFDHGDSVTIWVDGIDGNGEPLRQKVPVSVSGRQWQGQLGFPRIPPAGNIQIPLFEGLNLIAYGADSHMTAYDLIQALGGPSDIVSVQRLDPSTGGYQRVEYASSGHPQGEDFNIVNGEGYLVRARRDRSIASDIQGICPSIDLQQGSNLIGVLCEPQHATAYQWIQSMGGETAVSAIQSFNPVTGRFEFAAFLDDQLTGTDFPIRIGEGYLLHMREQLPDFRP